MKDELGGKTMKEFDGLRAETCSYLVDDGSKNKKAKGTKKCVIKRKLKFENFVWKKMYLTQIVLKKVMKKI